MNYTVKTIYTEEALVNFKRFTLNKKSFLKPALLYIFCIAVFVCSFVYNGKFEFNFTTILYPSLAVVCSIIITLIYYVKPHAGNDRMVGKEVEYTFTNEYVELGELHIPYDEFEKIYEDNNYFYFYATENDGFYIEKAALNFDLNGFLKENVFNKKILKIKK